MEAAVNYFKALLQRICGGTGTLAHPLALGSRYPFIVILVEVRSSPGLIDTRVGNRYELPFYVLFNMGIFSTSNTAVRFPP
jgi:hypothetical protein